MLSSSGTNTMNINLFLKEKTKLDIFAFKSSYIPNKNVPTNEILKRFHKFRG